MPREVQVYFVDEETLSQTKSRTAVKGTPVDGRMKRDPAYPKEEEEESSESVSEVSSEQDWAFRETWSGRMDFLLSCIGFAVGLGNIWRFPYLCYSSGGGAFLIPYTIFLVFCGLPLFFLEVSFGQFASLSPITIWRICPIFKGIGYGMVTISGIVCIYYNIIVTWNFFFLFESMRSVLPWTLCDREWNTKTCVVTSKESNVQPNNKSSINESLSIGTSSEEFWNNKVLEKTSGINHMGELRWPLFGYLLLAWSLVFLCLCKGVKSSGKVVYVTATFPYLVLLILLIRGFMLPGALEGIKFYLIPDWGKLLSIKVWGDAAVQIFYSIGFAWGSLITMSSYNKFNNNVYKDAMIVPLINCGTSVFAGLVIFSVLGFMSQKTGVELSKVASSGPGLIYVVYPQAVAMMPVPQLWAILFFLMVFTVGLDSQFGMFETLTSAFIDEYPHFLRKKKISFTLFMCVIEFLLGIPMIFQGGIYLLTVVDWYAAAFSVMVISILECIILSWIYGVDRFRKDIELMLGYQPHVFWRTMWKFVTPVFILFTLASAVMAMSNVTLGTYQYPFWAVQMGWCFTFSSLMPIPICAVIAVCRETGTLAQRIRKAAQPTPQWGPAAMEDRQKYLASLTGSDRDRFEAALKNIDYLSYINSRFEYSGALPEETSNIESRSSRQEKNEPSVAPYVHIEIAIETEDDSVTR